MKSVGQKGEGKAPKGEMEIYRVQSGRRGLGERQAQGGEGGRGAQVHRGGGRCLDRRLTRLRRREVKYISTHYRREYTLRACLTARKARSGLIVCLVLQRLLSVGRCRLMFKSILCVDENKYTYNR